MRLGGFSPLPWTMGGGTPVVQTLYESLNASLGTAYDTSEESPVTATTMAMARSLAAVWGGNKRMSFAADPKRLPSELIPRWEKILDVHPSVGDTDVERRRALQTKFLAWVGPVSLTDFVTSIIGDNLVGIEFCPLTSALIRWPENGFANDWTSTIAFINIRVEFTPNQTLVEFINVMGRMTRALDEYLPSWTGFNWSVFNSDGDPGFLLDDPQNLDFESFD